jgi:hypothetical protein
MRTSASGWTPARTLDELRGQHESGIHNTGNQGRDFKIESGIASARRPSEGQSGTTAEDVSSGKKKKFTGTESPVEESQGIKEIEKSDLVSVPTSTERSVGVNQLT